MSSAGRAPAAYPKVGLTQRRSASSASPTEPTPACRSVSPGMKAREYRRKVGGRKAAVRPRRDPWPQRRRTAQKRPLRGAAQPDRDRRVRRAFSLLACPSVLLLPPAMPEEQVACHATQPPRAAISQGKGSAPHETT